MKVILKWICAASALIVASFGLAYSQGVQDNRLDHVEKTVEEHQEKVEGIDVIQNDVKHIIRSIDEVKDIIRERPIYTE